MNPIHSLTPTTLIIAAFILFLLVTPIVCICCYKSKNRNNSYISIDNL